MSADKPDLKVVEVDFGNLNDLPAMLRAIADDTEAGERPHVRGAACFEDDTGRLTTYGWGACTDIEAIGLLTAGSALLAAGKGG